MKKLISLIIAGTMVFAAILSSYADRTPTGQARLSGQEQLAVADQAREDKTIVIEVNGKRINFDVPPVIIRNRTLIPVRAVSEALGADVDWNREQPHIVTITKNVNNEKINVVINLTTGKITKNGKEVVFDVGPQVVQNRTMVPLRFLAEMFGMDVNYDQETKVISISDEGPEPVSARAVSEKSVIVAFDKDIERIVKFEEGDIVITDGKNTQKPVTASVSKENKSEVVISTLSLNAYDFSKTTIYIAQDKFKNAAGNGSGEKTINVEDKYATPATNVAIYDVGTAPGISGEDFMITWGQAADNVVYYNVYLFRADYDVIFAADPSEGYIPVGTAPYGTGYIIVRGNTDSNGKAA